MPISPKKAAKAKKQNKQTQRLFADIDKQLKSKGEASIWNPTPAYGLSAIENAIKTYKKLGWNVKHQQAGQFDIEEGLIVRRK